MKLKKQDKLTVLSALLIGVICGSYLYLVGFAPQFQSDQGVAGVEDIEAGLVIVGDIYGGSRVGLTPSFQLESDGSYRYIPFSDDPEVPADAREGSIPRALLRELKSVLTIDTLAAASLVVTRDICAQMVDGMEYRYTIIRDGEEYELDTCMTDFTNDSPAGTVLLRVWEYLENGAQLSQ